MKIIVFVSFVAVVSGFYTDIDDSIDVDHLIKNSDELKAHLDCYLDRKPCTDQMLGYKRHIVDAMNNTCKDCSTLQKHKLEEVFKVVVAKFPDDLVELRKKYKIDTKHFVDMVSELAKFDQIPSM